MVTRSIPATPLRPASAAPAHEMIALWSNGVIATEPVVRSICRRVGRCAFFTGGLTESGLARPHSPARLCGFQETAYRERRLDAAEGNCRRRALAGSDPAVVGCNTR